MKLLYMGALVLAYALQGQADLVYNGVEEVVIDADAPSVGATHIVDGITFCSDTQQTIYSLRFTDRDISGTDTFSVPPYSALSGGPLYTATLKTKKNGNINLTQNTAASVTFVSKCKSNQQNATVELTFRDLNDRTKTPPGYYASVLRIIKAVPGGPDKVKEIPITIKVGDSVKISGLEDLLLANNNGEWSDENTNICVFSSTGSYTLEAQSSNNWELVQTTRIPGIKYNAVWNGTHDLHSQNTTGVLTANKHPDCLSGLRSQIRISVPDTNIPPGVYNDTITLIVRPS
ncbi:hypothetical protein GCM10023116_26990 [Kistimonas scapharcae]|uniref:Spore coat protein U domain-containing protein n=1 Tax=Kistimonas scapharcae TaxID=1036133 RepID=A0ABP8V3N8_9GAMM